MKETANFITLLKEGAVFTLSSADERKSMAASADLNLERAIFLTASRDTNVLVSLASNLHAISQVRSNLLEKCPTHSTLWVMKESQPSQILAALAKNPSTSDNMLLDIINRVDKLLWMGYVACGILPNTNNTNLSNFYANLFAVTDALMSNSNVRGYMRGRAEGLIAEIDEIKEYYNLITKVNNT